MERKFSVYMLASPSGGMYVGITSTKMKDRWRGHLRMYKSDINHPLYNAMRKHGPENFSIQILHKNLTKEKAFELEILHISAIPKSVRYNIAAGGEGNTEGSYLFWAKMNSNPEMKKEYLAKLSAVKKANDWTDYKKLSEQNSVWRKDNPRLAYKMAYRGVRLANKSQKGTRNTPPPNTRTLLEKLRWKHNRSRATHLSAKALWARRTEEEYKDVTSKISAKALERMSTKTPEEKAEITKCARAAIDRKKQGPAASKGIKKFWAELKKDPARYKAYMDARTASLMKTITKQKQL